MSAVLLTCQGIKKSYKALTESVNAVNDVSFTVKKGEFVMIYGPSGCGKSSLLNLLAGLDIPDEGDILFDTLSYRTAKDRQLTFLRRSRIGVIFQNFELIPVMTCYENIEYPLLRLIRDPTLRRQRIIETAEQLNIVDLLKRKPAQVSGGQRQRAAIARTLAIQPDLILGDEVTGNLDSCNSRLVFDVFKDLNRKFGQTFVMVSHDQSLKEYASRILEMKDGCIIGGNI